MVRRLFQIRPRQEIPTYNNTTKEGKSYTTQTTRSPDGFVTRKRIGSNTPKSRKNAKSSDGIILIVILVAVAFVPNLFGVV